MTDTKSLILDTAERLFADRGFADTSVRSITQDAGVNLAAIHYHFGSKEALLGAVLARRLEPLNQERLETLDQIEAESGTGRPPPLEAILEAFIGPALRLKMAAGDGGEQFMRLMGRTFTDPHPQIKEAIHEQFSEIICRFTRALMNALPRLERQELYWRVHFMVGVMAHCLAGMHHLDVLSEGTCDHSDCEEILSRMVPFVAAGMRAPARATAAEGRA